MSFRVEGVKKSFKIHDNSITILSDVSFEIQTNEIVALLGPSGSGKSTLLSLLAGLDLPDHGKIFLNKTDISSLTQDGLVEFRKNNIGFVFQQFHLFPHLTALENVQFPLEIKNEFDQEQILQKSNIAIEKVGLTNRKNQYPSQLSGGECQRVAIARSVIHEPKIILADEPSGNLDTKTSDSVMSYFFDLVRSTKASCLLVTHSLELAKKCDRILEIKNGSLC